MPKITDPMPIISKKDDGFTLVELIIVVALIGLLSLLAFPYFKDAISDSKTPAAGADFQKIITVITSNHIGVNASYATSNTVELATISQGMSSVFVPNAGLTVITHTLGDTVGSVTMAPATITTANDAGKITVNSAPKGSCPGFPLTQANVVAVISINGTTVKANGGSFNASTASTACTTGDTNTYTFTFK